MLVVKEMWFTRNEEFLPEERAIYKIEFFSLCLRVHSRRCPRESTPLRHALTQKKIQISFECETKLNKLQVNTKKNLPEFPPQIFFGFVVLFVRLSVFFFFERENVRETEFLDSIL